MENKKIPVTIITGFLGSGKTTLLNNLIEKYKNKRFAIIENEFGDINIDRSLISKTEGSTIYELSNGCICCTLNKELGITLNSLIMSYASYDHLIIESTGIADPGDIVQTFLSGKRVQRYFELDSVICVIDALNVLQQLKENEETRKQAALANTILINKSDCIDKQKTDLIREELAVINSSARLHSTTYTNIDDYQLLEVFAFAPQKLEQEFSAIDFSLVKPAFKNGNGHNITSHSFCFNGGFELSKFSLWMESFLLFNTNRIYRVKGIINIHNDDRKYIVQGVNASLSLSQGSAWDTNEERCSKLVFIGKNLEKNELEENLVTLMSNE